MTPDLKHFQLDEYSLTLPSCASSDGLTETLEKHRYACHSPIWKPIIIISVTNSISVIVIIMFIIVTKTGAEALNGGHGQRVPISSFVIIIIIIIIIVIIIILTIIVM